LLRISRSDANIHSQFDPALDPVATVGPGQTLEVETAHHLALYKRELTEDDLLETLPFDLLNPLTGPIAIKGAQPGDTVVIQIDAIELGSRGDCPLISSGGLLQGHLRAPYMRIFEVKDRLVQFEGGIEFPIAPMAGALGMTPATPIHTVHPGDHGGNLDDINVAPGARLYFPVFVEGGMFCIGDVHASQGDSEWCGPLEMDATVTLTIVELVKGTEQETVWTETDNHWIVYGAEPTLYDSIESAAFRMARAVSSGLDLSLEDTALLLSNVSHIRLCQACKGPFNPVVRSEFPKSIDRNGRLRGEILGSR
jgi:amidase